MEKRMFYPKLLIWISALVLLSGCQLAGLVQQPTQAPAEPSADVVGTLVSVGATQTALAGLPLEPATAAPQDTAVPIPTEPPAPTPTTEPVPTETEELPPMPESVEPEPVFDGKAVAFGGVQFSLPAAMASGASGSIVPAQYGSEAGFPGDFYPDYVQFDLEGYVVPDAFHDPVIRVWPVGDYQAISQPAADMIEKLQLLLANPPAEVAHDAGLPFLPFWMAAQVFNSNVEFLDFQNGSGVRYLTMYAQASYPVDNYNIFYTFQGLTADNSRYISVVLPIKCAWLPDRAQDPADWEAFGNEFLTYIEGTVQMLNKLPADNFLPDMFMIDATVASLLIAP